MKRKMILMFLMTMLLVMVGCTNQLDVNKELKPILIVQCVLSIIAAVALFISTSIDHKRKAPYQDYPSEKEGWKDAKFFIGLALLLWTIFLIIFT